MQELLVRGALEAVRLPDRVAAGVRAAINGLLLGLLREDGLRELDERYFTGVGAYRAPGWNEQGLFSWERPLVERFFAPGSSVLVAACGGGREVLALLEAGYDAYGCEPHPELLAFAERFLTERGYPDRVARAQRSAIPAGPTCDGLIVGWGGYSLVQPRAQRIAFLREAGARVKPGGPLLMSYFQRAVHDRELRWTRTIASALGGAVELGDTLMPTRAHVFTPAEVAEELAEAGLALAAHQLVGRAHEATATYHAAAISTVP